MYLTSPGSVYESVNSGFSESLEALERGEMKYTGMGGGDTEAEVEDDVDVDPDADADPETDLDPEVELDPEIKEEVDDEEAIVEQVNRYEDVYLFDSHDLSKFATAECIRNKHIMYRKSATIHFSVGYRTYDNKLDINFNSIQICNGRFVGNSIFFLNFY